MFACAFSNWVNVINPEPINDDVNFSEGLIKNDINGIKVTYDSNFNVGKYFYYVEGERNRTTELLYTLHVKPALLDDSFKLESGNGYSFSLKGQLSLDNLSIFSNNSNLEAAKLNGVDLPLKYQNYVVEFMLPIQTSTRGNAIEDFKLSFTFNNNLIINYRNSLLKNNFTLRIIGGGDL